MVYILQRKPNDITRVYQVQEYTDSTPRDIPYFAGAFGIEEYAITMAQVENGEMSYAERDLLLDKYHNI